MKLTALILPLALMSVNVLAADAKPEKSDFELGILNTSGNTNSTSIKASVKYNQDFTHWRNQYILTSLYKKDEVESERNGEAISEKQVSAEQYFASVQSDYKLNDKHKALFMFGSYDATRFSGYDYQATLALGFSDRLFEGDNSFLDYNVGPGMTFSRTDELYSKTGVLLEDNVSDQSAILRVAANYQYTFSPTAKFTQSISSDVAVESGANTRTKSESALIANLNQALAMKASFTITNNSQVQESLKATDTQTALTIVYSF